MIKVVCWNVNSVKIRLNILEQLVKTENPDVILLQELKCETDKFPEMEISDMGYNMAVHGQKSYNGVAILSRSPLEDIKKGLSNFEDDQARYIEAFTSIKGVGLRVASVYVPNGQEIGSEKWNYKLNFFDALIEETKNNLTLEENFVLGGDFNVAPFDIDVYDVKHLDGSVGFHQKEREKARKLMALGMYDSFRTKHKETKEFSWWDYRAGSFQNDKGMRIDQIYTSPEATDLMTDASILRRYREMEKTSDHAPILLTLASHG